MKNEVDTTENNKMIAEFMGGLYNNQARLSLQSNEIWLPYHGVCNYKNNNGKCLKYHSSWDWLMEVVEKIESLENEENYYLYDVIIFPDAVLIESKDIGEIILINKSKGTFTTKIEAVYTACIEFIQWYNEKRA